MTHVTEVTLVVLLAGAMISIMATLSLAASRKYGRPNGYRGLQPQSRCIPVVVCLAKLRRTIGFGLEV